MTSPTTLTLTLKSKHNEQSRYRRMVVRKKIMLWKTTGEKKKKHRSYNIIEGKMNGMSRMIKQKATGRECRK